MIPTTIALCLLVAPLILAENTLQPINGVNNYHGYNPILNEDIVKFYNYLYRLATENEAGQPKQRQARCINLWDEGCSNGGLTGSGTDTDYLENGGNPGKRSGTTKCLNVWDEGCRNGELIDSGLQSNYLQENFAYSPGKRDLLDYLKKKLNI